MAALPYIQLYVADYLADTMHLTTEEHGAYLLLIMNYWQTGKPIPKKRLASVVRLSNERWNLVKDSLNEFFTEGQQGEWIHDRLEQDLEKVKSKSSKASKAGKASAAKRAAAKAVDSKDNSNKRSNERSKCVEPEPNHTDTDTDTDTETETEKNKFTDEDFALAEFMFERILVVADKTKKPNLNAWAEVIRLMRERDKYHPDEIRQVFTWANEDHFWSTNILSPAKLRKQFARLSAQANKPVAPMGLNKQESLEARNRVVAAEWVRSMTGNV